MFIIFGILFIVAGIAMLIIRPTLSEEVVVEENKWGDKEETSAAHPILLWFNGFKSTVILTVGFVFMLSSGLFFIFTFQTNILYKFPIFICK